MPLIPTVVHNGPAIRAFRLLRGLTVAELAGLVDIARPSLANIERENKLVVSRRLASAIAHELDIDVAAIVRFPGPADHALPSAEGVWADASERRGQPGPALGGE